MTIRAEERGAAERLLDLVLNSSAHLWHNRPGVNLNGVWHPATRRHRAAGAPAARPGLFVPAAVDLYSRLLEIYRLNAELMAHFASYALTRDRLARPQSLRGADAGADRARASRCTTTTARSRSTTTTTATSARR